MSRRALAILAVALLMGACLRFIDLGARQMSADEGATWAAADASSIGEVIALQRTHNPGKLPLHDLFLHGWIALFGDGLLAMRSFSALFGLATILLMFPFTREIFRIPSGHSPPPFSEAQVDLIGASSALIASASLIVIKYDRDARMYAPMLAIAIAHLWFFLRALRRQSIVEYTMLALQTAALIAINPITIVMLGVEGIWLLVTIASPRFRYRNRIRVAFLTGGAIVAGVAILLPALATPLTAGHQAFSSGKFDWLVKPSWWEPVSFFNKATGSVAFPILFALAAWGAWRMWTDCRGAAEFLLLLMWAPPILLVAGSLLWHPMFIERYAIYSFPPFFILIATGILGFKGDLARGAALGAVAILALGHIYSYSRKTHEVDWREASRVAEASLRPGDIVAVAPPYAVEVVRYYMQPPLRSYAAVYDAANNSSRVAILAEHGVNMALDARVRREYPRPLAHANGVVVLSRE